MNGYMNGARALEEENTINAPSNSSMITSGQSHHFFSCFRNCTNSWKISHTFMIFANAWLISQEQISADPSLNYNGCFLYSNESGHKMPYSIPETLWIPGIAFHSSTVDKHWKGFLAQDSVLGLGHVFLLTNQGVISPQIQSFWKIRRKGRVIGCWKQRVLILQHDIVAPGLRVTAHRPDTARETNYKSR